MPLTKDLAILCVDAQPEFLSRMHGDQDAVLARIEALFKMANLADLPTVATFEEPTDKKGWFPDRLEAAFPPSGKRFSKSCFNAMEERTIRAALTGAARKAIAVAGAETDVCILFTVLGLLDQGYDVYFVEDCCFTSTRDPSAALRRMERAGAIACTAKTLIYELAETVDRAVWPRTWQKKLDLFPDPEELP